MDYTVRMGKNGLPNDKCSSPDPAFSLYPADISRHVELRYIRARLYVTQMR